MRTLLLAVLAAGAVLLALVLQPAERKTGAAAVTGARLVRIPRRAVRRLELSLGQQEVVALSTDDGWTVDGRPTDPAMKAALDDLTDALVGLRAVDQFRGTIQQSFGFDPPRGSIVVGSQRRTVRLLLGAFTATTATLYARREGDPRVFQIGTYLLAAIGRVLDR